MSEAAALHSCIEVPRMVGKIGRVRLGRVLSSWKISSFCKKGVDNPIYVYIL